MLRVPELPFMAEKVANQRKLLSGLFPVSKANSKGQGVEFWNSVLIGVQDYRFNYSIAFEHRTYTINQQIALGKDGW